VGERVKTLRAHCKAGRELILLTADRGADAGGE
jgi:hypothetical protein